MTQAQLIAAIALHVVTVSLAAVSFYRFGLTDGRREGRRAGRRQAAREMQRLVDTQSDSPVCQAINRMAQYPGNN